MIITDSDNGLAPNSQQTSVLNNDETYKSLIVTRTWWVRYSKSVTSENVAYTNRDS